MLKKSENVAMVRARTEMSQFCQTFQATLGAPTTSEHASWLVSPSEAAGCRQAAGCLAGDGTRQ